MNIRVINGRSVITKHCISDSEGNNMFYVTDDYIRIRHPQVVYLVSLVYNLEYVVHYEFKRRTHD